VQFGPSQSTLLSMGAKDPVSIRQKGWWRLFSSCWLHAGIIHLLMNMLALYRLVRPRARARGARRADRCAVARACARRAGRWSRRSACGASP
jgi:membrane associated rhomboid family serine protease